MSKTTNKFSPEVRERAVRLVLEHRDDYPSLWAAVVSVSHKIGCAPPTLHDWIKKAEINSGKRAGIPDDVSERMKALEWVDWFNNKRLLEPIGNIPPAEAEKNYYVMLDEKPMAA